MSHKCDVNRRLKQTGEFALGRRRGGGCGVQVDVDLLRRTLKFHGLTNEIAGKALGVSRDAFQRRLRERSFRIDEIHMLMRTVPLTKDEVWQIFFSE